MTENNSDKKFIVNPLIVLREEFDDWSVLFDPDTGEAYGLDPTGTYIWQQLTEKNSIGDILGKIKNKFEDVPDNYQEEINDFLTNLQDRGFITNA